MFALIDCDHFFASCERVFRPDLWRRPVAVLSNNDGCVIARSPEVKALGVKMGAPLFECATLLRAHQAHIFSANFSLYADLSARVMDTIRASVNSPHRERVEVYSIDEAFVDLKEVAPRALFDLASNLRHTLFSHIGIPVSIGIAPTKTLAKVATHYAKRDREGVWMITDESNRVDALRHLPVEEVWGVGKSWAARLRDHGIYSALQLAEISRDRLNAAARHRDLRRTARELKGERCMSLEPHASPRSSIRYSRSFSRGVSAPHILRDALGAFAGSLGQRLRAHELRAGTLLLWLTASLPRPRGERRRPLRYTVKASAALPVYTHDSSSLLHLVDQLATQLIARANLEAPSALSRPIPWCKAGVLALDLRDRSQGELNLFQSSPQISQQAHQRHKLSELEDLINQRFGQGCARIGGVPFKVNSPHLAPSWAPKRAHLSPRYTTNWIDLPVVHADR